MKQPKAEKAKKPLPVRSLDTRPFKLKDKNNRYFMAINLIQSFRFVPEIIVVEKVRGKNNTMIVRAILTEEKYQEFNKNRDTSISDQRKKLLEAKREKRKQEQKPKGGK